MGRSIVIKQSRVVLVVLGEPHLLWKLAGWGLGRGPCDRQQEPLRGCLVGGLGNRSFGPKAQIPPGLATCPSMPSKEAWWRKGDLLHGSGHTVGRGRVSLQPIFSLVQTWAIGLNRQGTGGRGQGIALWGQFHPDSKATQRPDSSWQSTGNEKEQTISRSINVLICRMRVWQSHDILGMWSPCQLGEAEEPAQPEDQEVWETRVCTSSGPIGLH
jgi:hypothetical protein